jgi:hypothetical protein
VLRSGPRNTAAARFGQGARTGPVPLSTSIKDRTPSPSSFLPLHLLSHKPSAGCFGPRSPSITCGSTEFHLLSWIRPDATSAGLAAAEYPDSSPRLPRSPTLNLISLDHPTMILSVDGVALAEIRAQELQPCTCLRPSSLHLHSRDSTVTR